MSELNETNISAAFDLIGQAEFALQSGHMDQAKETIQRCVEEYPGFGPACNHLGWMMVNEGQYEQAEAFYRKAIALSPDFGSTYINLTIFLNAQRRIGRTGALSAPPPPDHRRSAPPRCPDEGAPTLADSRLR
jgi:tetratricopeptide (TPR) repeat protein